MEQKHRTSNGVSSTGEIIICTLPGPSLIGMEVQPARTAAIFFFQNLLTVELTGAARFDWTSAEAIVWMMIIPSKVRFPQSVPMVKYMSPGLARLDWYLINPLMAAIHGWPMIRSLVLFPEDGPSMFPVSTGRMDYPLQYVM